jgi:intracellular sulfur oxidation DsrE/DsrF family protein
MYVTHHNHTATYVLEFLQHFGSDQMGVVYGDRRLCVVTGYVDVLEAGSFGLVEQGLDVNVCANTLRQMGVMTHRVFMTALYINPLSPFVPCCRFIQTPRISKSAYAFAFCPDRFEARI